MMEGQGSRKKRDNDLGFTDYVFSWSLDDISNENFFKNRVEKIPESFQSVQHYLDSYILPLLEETRAQLSSSMDVISRAPFAEVVAFDESKPYGTKLYDVKVDYWRNRFRDHGKEPYKTLPGDILVLADAKPETASDMQRVGRTWSFVMVNKISEDENDEDSTSTYFKVKASKDMEVSDGMQKSLFVIFLCNVTTNKRIWNSLHKYRNLKIIKETLCTNSVVEENCEHCSLQSDGMWDEKLHRTLSSALNESQRVAILACIHKIHCDHKSFVELIWGPPGTGKTKTVSMLLVTLLRMTCRTLICAPTNVAITEVAFRVLKLVKELFETDSETDALFYSLGDILLFGNKERLKVGSEIEEIYLDYRVQRLAECCGPLTGWRHCFASMVDFLEDCVSHYDIFLENELIKERERINDSETEIKEKDCKNKTEDSKGKHKSFIEFARDRFASIVAPLRKCVLILCTHIPKNYILEHNFKNMVSLIELLDSFETLLFRNDVVSEELEEFFSHSVDEDYSESLVDTQYLLYTLRSQCLSVLRSLLDSLKELGLPSVMNKGAIMDFCFKTASLIFCTASSSYKLHSVEMEPLNLLVIDEAAQLKECESTIPLQLPAIKHAILIGDECQLPAMVESKVSGEAGFGRSLFERLSSLGHSKHLLNIQYRMHPSISSFPNSNFYHRLILDAPNVKRKSYEKKYLECPMFGPYSFINIIGGREEFDDNGRSRKNMVEVSVVLKILRNLYRAWIGSKQRLSVGVISPYNAQVAAIQEKVEWKYENLDGFVVKVKSVDGFQGGEEDIIIISTVRSTTGIKFISNPKRTNVALTRARHCLWILGNEKTLANSESVWEALICDAKNRQCFFNADEDKDLAKAILEVKKEFDQLDDLLNGDSVLFRSARWRVLFSDNFLKSFKRLTPVRTKKSVLNLLLKLASGWRPKKRKVDSVCGSSSQILKKFKVEGLYIVCTIDIVKEFKYIQVLKVWDILPLEDIQKLEKRLDGIFGKYTDDFINHCKEKCLEGDLEVPKTWPTSSEIVRLKDLSSNEIGNDLSGVAFDGRSYVENSKVSESLSVMKFYALSSGIVSHLLSDRDGRELDLPFEVTDQELEIIVFPRSTFILGRSGTGKTTVLTMKLFKKEELYHKAMEGFYGVEILSLSCGSHKEEVGEGIGERKGAVLRQLFVTVSPKLCYAVKQHISDLKSSACGENFPAERSSIDIDSIDDTAQFKGIPDSFVDIPPKSYPLVITFHKFLMMLDGTLGNSYFERFHDVRKLSDGQIRSLRSVALQTFIRTKEINYERFSSTYWPHFNTQLTKKLDSSKVFTEIISHIKGGLQAIEASDGKLSREDYVQLSEARVSSLSKQKREKIYDLFQNYERMKMENGEFDLADLVIDLHRRLRDGRYGGDGIDFVYIDEVQDLTMSQIALFRYICRNVEDGFVFSGDTAQTIARGIDFRFEDIRSLFYKKFVLESRRNENDERKEKGHLSPIFNLSQNFRTHAGVLKLSQSIIELLYRFFPQSIDVLKPETSLIYGEPPVLLESGNDENAIITIFGNSRNVSGNMVGFGAEQVILVRDDSVRKEISNCVGKQALVLTIVECKGLEFQDVLLYNFFGSSPLKNQWRVIYGYMKEQDLLDSTSHMSFPSFSEAKHNVLCSELKQLYVAVTRTRQRLWICENIEELSKPIFDYWKKKCLVQVRQLDDSLAQAMQVASSPEEWRSRGIKLFSENNYEMATMCFERAGDTYWERGSKAAGLKANAERMRVSNPEEANSILREAAEIFEVIGKADLAAQCFSDLGEYERAGRIYMENCGESELQRAGECFSLAGCYELAAEVYARGNFFSECLIVCTKGKLFEMGLQYIQYWKQHATADNCLARRSKEIDKIEQEFLERCALHYHELKDKKSMMKFVKAFHSMDLIRNFLKSLGSLDELLLLEEESGNFLEAANIAKLRGDMLLVTDLLEKAGHFKEASTLILSYVFSSSLWSPGSKGWPLKQFTQKKELLTKAKSFAKNESNHFYEFVCTEADILSNDHNNLLVLYQQLNDSQRHKSIRGEILSARKILDVLLHSSASKFGWEDDLVLDLRRHSEDRIYKNQVSIETLIYFWNYWKDKIVNIFEYLGNLGTEDVNEYRSYGEFCLNYLGVWKQYNSLNTIYLLLNSDADWTRELDDRYIRRSGKLACIDVRQLVSAAQGYWCSEVLSVGMKVLDILEACRNLSIKNSLSVFCQSKSLTHIYEVSKFLLGSKFLELQFRDTKTLQNLIGLSTGSFFGNIFSLDWKESLRESMISLRGTEVSRSMLKEIIENIGPKNKLSYGQVGRVAMMILGSAKLDNELYEKVAERFDAYPPWMAFIKRLCRKVESESPQGSAPGNNNELPSEVSLVWELHRALVDTFNANWRIVRDYITPDCFLYLLERLLILLSYFQGYFFATKSSFLEWLIHQDGNTNPSSISLPDVKPSMGRIIEFLEYVLQRLLYEKSDTMEWIKKSSTNVKDHYRLVVLKLVVIICLLHVNFGTCSNLLFNLLGWKYITEQLPLEFYNALRRGRKHNYLNVNVNVLAEAFKRIGNPLVIASLGKTCSKSIHPDAIFVDMKLKKCKEDILIVLFPKIIEASQGPKRAVEMEVINSCRGVLSLDSCDQGKSSKLPSSNSASVGDQGLNAQEKEEVNMLKNHFQFWEILEALKSMDNIGTDRGSILLNSPRIKVDLEKCIQLLSAAMDGCFSKNASDGQYNNLLGELASMLDEMKQLYMALNISEQEFGNNSSKIGELYKKLQSRRPSMEPSLNQLFLQHDMNLMGEASKTSIASGGQYGEEDSTSKAGEVNNSERGEASQVTVASGTLGNRKTENKGKGKSKPKKNKKGKGGRKHM